MGNIQLKSSLQRSDIEHAKMQLSTAAAERLILMKNKAGNQRNIP